jgi:hypothetical protein
MNIFRVILGSSLLALLTATLITTPGCATRERVVVRDRPAEVRVVEPAPVVHERVTVRP